MKNLIILVLCLCIRVEAATRVYVDIVGDLFHVHYYMGHERA